MNEKITVKPHFIYAFTLLYPYLSLLIIPVIRGVYRFLVGKSSTLSAFFVAEAAMLLLAFLAALLKLKSTKLLLDGDIAIQKGLIFKVRYVIPKNVSKVIMIESDPFSRIFGIYRLKIYTEAGRRRRPDESIPISHKTAKRLFGMLKIEGQTVKSNTVGNVVMSAALSSSMTGFLLAFPIVKAVVSLVGEGVSAVLPKLRQQSLGAVELEWLGRALPVIFLVGYAVSFAVLLLRNSGFSSVKSGNRIMLDSGRLPHRTLFLDIRSVSAVKTVTAPLMRLAGKCAVKFSACGFGRSKGEIGLLLPCVKPQLAKGLTKWLLPQFNSPKATVVPCRKAIPRCIYLPCAVLLLTIVSAVAVHLMLKYSSRVLVPLVIIAFIIISLWLMGRLFALLKGGFSFDVRSCKVIGQQGFGTVEMLCSRDDIEYIRILQTPFDRRHRQCSVKVATSTKNRDTVKVRYLDKHKVEALLQDTSQSV